MNILFRVFILHHYVKLFCKIKHYLMMACSISSYVKINENDFMPYTFFHYIISKMIIGIPQLLFIHALEYLRGRIMLRKSYNVSFLEWYITAWQYHICLFIVISPYYAFKWCRRQSKFDEKPNILLFPMLHFVSFHLQLGNKRGMPYF